MERIDSNRFLLENYIDIIRSNRIIENVYPIPFLDMKNEIVIMIKNCVLSGWNI